MVAALLLMLFTSIAMTVAMLLAWQQFGRERYILFWAASYSASAVQWVANGAGLLLHSPLLMALTSVTLILSAALSLAGMRMRAGRARPWQMPMLSALLVAVPSAIIILATNMIAAVAVAIPIYISIVLVISAMTLKPIGRRFRPAELVYCIILSVFALYEWLLIGAGFQAARTGTLFWKTIYRQVLGWGVPILFVCGAIAAILMIAGDLAARLSQQLLRDPLTNVLNRRGLDAGAAEAIETARREARPVALVLCDLDSFKALNDSFGHLAGDAALQQFARSLEAVLQPGDVLGRLGGDEFALLLLGRSGQQAADAMGEVRTQLEAIVLARASEARLRSSFGIVEQHDGAFDWHDLVSRADKALYAAKKAGSGSILVHSEVE